MQTLNIMLFWHIKICSRSPKAKQRNVKHEIYYLFFSEQREEGVEFRRITKQMSKGMVAILLNQGLDTCIWIISNTLHVFLVYSIFKRMILKHNQCHIPPNSWNSHFYIITINHLWISLNRLNYLSIFAHFSDNITGTQE